MACRVWAQDALPSPHAFGHDRNPCERSAMDGAERTINKVRGRPEGPPRVA
jgi:hypothetical protein